MINYFTRLSRIVALVLFSIVVIVPSGAAAGVNYLNETLKLRTKASEPVELNKWHASLDKCRKYAEEHGVPLIAVWSNGEDCGRCKQLESGLLHKTFKAWQATSGCVFLFVHSGDPDGRYKGAAFNFCKKDKYGFPYTRLYWYNGKTTRIDIGVEYGSLLARSYGQATAEKTVNFFKSKLKSYTPKTVEEIESKPIRPEYAGGNGFSGMPASISVLASGGASPLCIRVSRQDSLKAWVATNYLAITMPYYKKSRGTWVRMH